MTIAPWNTKQINNIERLDNIMKKILLALGATALGYFMCRAFKELTRPSGAMDMKPLEMDYHEKEKAGKAPTIIVDEAWIIAPPNYTMPEWRKKIQEDKKRFLEESRKHHGNNGDEKDDAPLLVQSVSDFGSDMEENTKFHIRLDTDDKAGDIPDATVPTGAEPSKFIDLLLNKGLVFTLGEKNLAPNGKDYKKVIRQAHKLSLKDPNFVLKLSGQTYGIGARGVLVDDHREYNAEDIAKLLAKIKSKTQSKTQAKK